MELLINKEYVLNTAKKILEFNSPTGFCFEIMDYIKDIVESFGYEFETTNKGCGVITVKGKKDDKVVGLSAHVDTLGAMVRSITSEGNLRFTSLGGPILPTLDGEYCKIRTRSGKIYTGTFLSESSAAHVFDDSSTRNRDEKNMVVRIDELVYSKEDVEKLDICSGDFIFIDTKTTITESGFIKSRFIDDKGSVSALIGLLEAMSRQKIVPSYTTKIIISTYEEVGHGASYIPQDITEMIAVDMGCIGDDLGCTEEMVSICAKDSGGPYDFNMTTDLINLAKDNNIGYAVDIYPRYGSDVGAALRGGNNIRGALIGPGVNASHGMERTHYSAIENTMKLLYFYLTK
ncbi:M42 family metallopeptidase [Sarcina sp. JB2]|uniref:M42 family metallopeptidase n=1 Tax=Candidatus Sarcina troglodytae TaxID=2726954 RepID=A0ACD1BB90_9CLOT|nr:M42 family metallopeptidase [Sarcina sp. JB2]QPJ84685.1 M42 family metallopeptidase [Sarcina sp. JB2]